MKLVHATTGATVEVKDAAQAEKLLKAGFRKPAAKRAAKKAEPKGE